MNALSPLNLTPKQNLENIPDPCSSDRPSTPRVALLLSAWIPGGQSRVFNCVHLCARAHELVLFQTTTYLHYRAYVHNLDQQMYIWKHKLLHSPRVP